MSNKLKIAVDIDGVLANLYDPIFKELGLSLTSEDVRTWNFFDELGVSRDMFWKAYKELWSVKYTAIPLVEEDAPTTIARLRERCEIHIMTSRPEETHLGTISWLKYRGIIYDKIIMLPPLTDKTKHLDDYLFLVDDSPNFAHHPKVIIYDRPWNRHINAKRRIRSLKELLEIEITAEAPPQRGV